MNVNENVTFESKTEIPIACSLLSNIRCPSVLVKKQALIYLLNNADSLNYATETGDEGISERIVDSNDKYVLYDRPELDQPAKCLSMDITTRNVPTKSGHPSTLNYNFLKQAIKEDLGQVSVHNAYLFPQSSASLKKTNIFQSSKFKARELNKRVLSEDEFPSGDIYQQLMVSKMSTCHQKHKNKFYTSRASKLFTNHDYDCKLPSRRRNHTIQTKRFQLCSNFPRVNLFIPFHEVQEFQRIQYQKAAKHRIGRQTYLCTTQLVHWFLSLHIVRCNIFLPVDRDITLCTQSVVLQDMPAPLTLIVANASSAEVTSSNVPNETTHCSQMYCLITESRCHFSITNRCAFHELGQKQLCSIHPMIAFRESYVYFKTFVPLFHSCQQVKSIHATYPFVYSLNTIVSTHGIFNVSLMVLAFYRSLLVETVCRRIRGERLFRNNATAVPRRLCYSLLCQFSEMNNVIGYSQLVLCNINPIIIKACKQDYVPTVVLEVSCWITSKSSGKIHYPYEMKAKTIIRGESLCYFLDFYTFLSHKAVRNVELPNYSPISIVCNKISSLLEVVMSTPEMIVWPTDSSFVLINSSILRRPLTVLHSVFFHTYFEETVIGDFQKRWGTKDFLLACVLCFGVYESHSLSINKSVDVLNVSTVRCILISQTLVIDDFSVSLNTQIHVSIKCNWPYCCICFHGVDLYSSMFDDCIQVADEVFVSSCGEHKIPESSSMECSIFQQSVLLSLENPICLSFSLIVVEYFTPSPIIQYKLFTSTVNSSKCESILFRKLLDVRQKQLQQKSLWTDWFYHSAMTTFSFIGASLSVNGLNSDDYSSFIGLLLALTTCGCICLYKNFSYTI
ncbi:unnamed protein product [Trichobilharzia regenti]|nr:unnamed protein product [Trichobilharzia regenti]